MSPPLVVAFALAGRVNIDLSQEPLGKGKDGKDVYLQRYLAESARNSRSDEAAFDPRNLSHVCTQISPQQNPLWNEIPSTTGAVYQWDPESTYIQEPPFFDRLHRQAWNDLLTFSGARPLAIFGDSVTTDHISPAGAIKNTSPAGLYLQEHGVDGRGFQQLRLAARQ